MRKNRDRSGRKNQDGRRSRSTREIIQGARDLRDLIELSGIDPEGEEAQFYKTLAIAGRGDLLEKFKAPIVQKAQDRILKRKVFSLPKETPGDGILIGNSFDMEEEGPPVYLALKSLERHTAVFGSSGTGKSYWMMWIIPQMIDWDFSVWIFDPEGEYSPLLQMFPREMLWYVKPGSGKVGLKLNPIEAHGDQQAWIGKIVSLMGDVYYLGDGGRTLLSGMLKEIYERRGCFKGTGKWPSYSIFWRFLDALKFAQSTRSRGYWESAMRCISGLLDNLGNDLDNKKGIPITEFANQSILFDLSDLDSLDCEFYMCLLLMLSATVESSKRKIVVCDEVHTVLNQYRQNRQTRGEPPLQDMIRRQRKRNTTFILIDQIPSQLPDVALGNCANWYIFQLTNHKCIQKVAAAMGLEGEKLRNVPLLPQRVGVFQNQDMGQACLVKIPILAHPAPPKEEVVLEEMRGILSQLPYTSGESQKIDIMSQGLFKQKKSKASQFAQAGKPNSLKEPNKNGSEGDEPLREAAEQEKVDVGSQDQKDFKETKPLYQESQLPMRLSLEEVKYLEAWNMEENHCLPLTVFDKRKGLSLAKGNALREGLVREQRIELRTIRSGGKGRDPRTVIIKEKGYEILRQMGVNLIPLKGKGDFDSKFWSKNIARYWDHKAPGSDPVIEDFRNGKAADVGVTVKEYRIAFEVQLSQSHVSENVVKDLQRGGFEEVVFCVLTKEDERKIRAKLNRELGVSEEGKRMLEKVSFQLLKTFLPRQPRSTKRK